MYSPVASRCSHELCSVCRPIDCEGVETRYRVQRKETGLDPGYMCSVELEIRGGRGGVRLLGS